MDTLNVLTHYKDIPCCPDLDTAPICDVIDFRRRLVFPTSIRGQNEQVVKVEVIFHTRFTRCTGPLALGDIVYSTTLLPGEKVRLATTDRRSRFSFDSESKLSYRSEQISEEQYRMRAMRAFMSDENVVDRGSDKYSEQGKWDFHGDASGSLGFFSAASIGAALLPRPIAAPVTAADFKNIRRSSEPLMVQSPLRADCTKLCAINQGRHQGGQAKWSL